MKCLGCYIEVKAGYCLKCRKKLFNKEKVSTKLSFDAPKSDNLNFFQDNTKKISISGVQLKYSLQLKNGQLELCEKEGAYILKPIPEARQLIALSAAPENEHVTMQIAEQIFGLKVAANALIYFKDGEPAYITKRFDVKENGTKYLQEDFAQLTQRTTHTHGETYKYEGSYAEIGNLIRQYVAAAIPALESFFKLVVFNYLISNGDAHLKNFSLYRTNENEYQLTPAYDLMSTVIHTPHESDVGDPRHRPEGRPLRSAASGKPRRRNGLLRRSCRSRAALDRSGRRTHPPRRPQWRGRWQAAQRERNQGDRRGRWRRSAGATGRRHSPLDTIERYLDDGVST